MSVQRGTVSANIVILAYLLTYVLACGKFSQRFCCTVEGLTAEEFVTRPKSTGGSRHSSIRETISNGLSSRSRCDAFKQIIAQTLRVADVVRNPTEEGTCGIHWRSPGWIHLEPLKYTGGPLGFHHRYFELLMTL